MKLAIVSDIHGNLEAFDSVLADIQRESADAVVSLGDNIGYGPDPELVNLRMMKLNIPSVMGNHEHAILKRGCIDAFNVYAKRSIELTIEMLSEKSFAFISKLPYFLGFQDCRFVHGVPPDSPVNYFHKFQGETLDALFHTFDEPVCFVGHTHKLDMAVFNGRNAIRTPLGQGVLNLDKQHRYIINVGSVGQPRDGSNRAKYSLWDTKTRVLENRAVAYDISAVAEKIKCRGFPLANALRLI